MAKIIYGFKKIPEAKFLPKFQPESSQGANKWLLYWKPEETGPRRG